MLEQLIVIFFVVSSLVAGVLNLAFLIRTFRNFIAVVETQANDPDLRRIGFGFMSIWGFVVFGDAIRVMVGVGLLLHQDKAGYLLLVTPIASLLVAVVGLRSFR